MQTLRQLLAISSNTFIESIRQPIFVVLLMVTALGLVLNPSLAAYTFDDDNKLLIDLGLSTLLLAGLLLAAFTATGVLSQELENRTVLTVVSKPVPRPLFVIGKFTGVAAALATAYWVLSLIFLLTVRHRVLGTAHDTLDGPVLIFGIGAGLLALTIATMGNYLYHWVFTSSFVGLLIALLTLAWLLVLLINKHWQFQSPLTDLNAQLLMALVMVFQAILLLAAVAIAASTRLGQVMTLVVCVGVLALGLVSGSLLRRFADDSTLADALYRFTPDLQYLWPADALTQHHDFTFLYLVTVTGYTALFVTAAICLAVALFQTRDVG